MVLVSKSSFCLENLSIQCFYPNITKIFLIMQENKKPLNSYTNVFILGKGGELLWKLPT